ncbi:RNA-guided endonuclease InsQ/TnpB family protein [Gloeothece verrucosa]|uniref:Putative transposase IS891/IS1136/IS1341 family n=1 Tax=Gloeothece verrucosa (strain PCC 7822) TaxID=497965 RepID=E0U8Z6_GLOV7|nr:RNA-guided endonuclease TnpB family protein [Gloeothece verrucosa]ADN16135.1 putative transposase IS891/IS1136/IS1341 family [Gloeothece verrucosa PCC 7822]
MLTFNYTYRIYPDALQEGMLLEWLETSRACYNYALREIKDWIASRKSPVDRCSLEFEYIMPADYPFPSYSKQQNALPKAKKIFPRLANAPSQVLQCTIRRLHDAWDFFKERGFGFPRFKKYGQMKSLLFPQFKTNPVTGWQIALPKLGKVQINLHRPIPESFAVKQVRVVRKAKGWFAVITISSPESLPSTESPSGHFIGVDLNLGAYVATSDGYSSKRPKFYGKEQSKLKLLQRRLSRKNKRSNNYEKARLKVEKQHNHIAFKRKDHQFKLAHKLCDMGDSIFVEDIDFRIMAKGMLGKHTLDAGFGQLRDIIKFVCWKRGKFFAPVDHRGTSQTCPNCRTEVRKTLSDRIHDCKACGYIQDRDIASAQEICNRGIETYCRQGLCRTETACQVEVAGAMSLANWRRESLWAGMSQGDLGSPTHNR